MRSPLAILIIGVSVVLIPKAALGRKVPVYIYRAPPTISPTSPPSYQPSPRPSLQPSYKPSLRPSLKPSSQPTGNIVSSLSASPKYQTSESESAAAKPSSFGFWFIVIVVGSILYLVGSKMQSISAPTPVEAEGNGSPVASSISMMTGGKGNAVETLGQAFTELSDLAEKTIFPVDADDRTKKLKEKKKESS